MDMDQCRKNWDYCLDAAHVWFRYMDTNKDGSITFEEFRQKQNLRNYPEDKVREAFNRIDTNHSGFIDEFEWTLNFIQKYYAKFNNVAKLYTLEDIIDSARLNYDETYCYRIARSLFIHIRRNSNHTYLHWDDFKNFYKKFANLEDEHVILAIFRSADVDKTNTIDQNEFIYAFMNEHFYKYHPARRAEVLRLMKEGKSIVKVNTNVTQSSIRNKSTLQSTQDRNTTLKNKSNSKTRPPGKDQVNKQKQNDNNESLDKVEHEQIQEEEDDQVLNEDD